MLIKFSSAFNTMIPKFSDFGISTSLCNWILYFLTNSPQYVRFKQELSADVKVS